MKKRKSGILTEYKTIILLLLYLIPHAICASGCLTIIPDPIDFGYVPLDREVTKVITVRNITTKEITNLSITIPDSLLSYISCECIPLTIESQDSVSIPVSFCCHEMFVTCKGLILIEYTFNDMSFLERMNVKGQPVLRRGWNWISVPKLNRKSPSGHEISQILKPLEPYARIVLCKSGVMENIEYTWSHMDLFYYDDVAFIKLRMLGGDDPVYPFEQNKNSLSLLPSDTPFDLQKGYNWIGYWLPCSQDMRQAFGKHWAHVYAIKAENWFYINQKFYMDDYRIIFDLPANQVQELHYGRGYVVIMTVPVKGFQWQNSKEKNIQYPFCKKTSYFSYEERANYEVVDVIGIPDNAEEVGAFNADGVCIGAGIVNEHHTAQILMYPCETKIDTGEIIFKLKYRDESDQRPAEYLLFDNTTKTFIDKQLHVNTQVYNIIKMCNE